MDGGHDFRLTKQTFVCAVSATPEEKEEKADVVKEETAKEKIKRIAKDEAENLAKEKKVAK